MTQLADQLAVAQRDAGLVGDGLQQDHVVLHEGPDVTLPVGHDEHADDATRAREGDGHRFPHAVGGEPAAGVGVPGGPRHQQRLPALDDLLEHPVVLGVDGSSERASRPLAPSRTAGDAPSGPTNAADARSDRSSLASPRTVVITWSISGDAHRLAEAVQPLQVEVPVGQRGARGRRAAGGCRTRSAARHSAVDAARLVTATRPSVTTIGAVPWPAQASRTSATGRIPPSCTEMTRPMAQPPARWPPARRRRRTW